MSTPNEDRMDTLADHEALRELSRGVLELAARAETEDAAARGALLERLRGLIWAVRCNLDREDKVLPPQLAQVDSWGPERVQQLDESHARQKAALAVAELAAATASSRAELAAISRDLIRELVRALRWEEHDLLGEELLRDDLVVINQEDG